MSSPLIEPHGGALIDRIVSTPEAEALASRARRLPPITLDPRELADLELIATGAASPLRGFLTSEDYASVLERMRLADGTVWPLPFTLAVDDRARRSIAEAGEAALYGPSGRLWGAVRASEVFQRDPLAESRSIYRTDSTAHPGVAYLLSRPRWLVGGEVQVLPLPADLPFARHRHSPRALRELIQARGWRRIAGFQTRNPIHRAHEHLTKVALELVDGLVIHPLVGETKSDDVPASVRFRAYQVLLDKYYPRERTLLAAFPAAMRYAGPREAIFHALVRKNYGITHLIVGRDHAGVGSFYGPFEAQELFEQFRPDELGVVPIKFDAAFFCQACGSLASTRTCPHEAAQRLELSGSKVRDILRSGGRLPHEFTRPEIAEILRAHYASGDSTNGASPAVAPLAAKDGRSAPSRSVGVHAGPVEALELAASTGPNGAGPSAVEALLAGQLLAAFPESARPSPQVVEWSFVTAPVSKREDSLSSPGFILWLTGLSGAGKTTLAQALRVQLMAESRRLEILDGDEVRTYLSKGLGFSKEDRDTNIRRIGYVARVLARNGVTVITAAISPYAETRNEVRQLAAQDKVQFVEVHVHAELQALIARDAKGLYKKALAGEIEHFTGVSDPYEAPTRPEVQVRTDLHAIHESAAKILSALRERGLIRSGSGEAQP
jgi:sulfate adenylyltransferase